MGKLSSYLAEALLTTLTCSGAADTPGAVPVAERFPDFSWDRVPLYMHIRKSTGFTPEELRYLAGFPLIAFEKTTGATDYGSTEKGTLEAARAVKRLCTRLQRMAHLENARILPLISCPEVRVIQPLACCGRSATGGFTVR